jgi:Transport and Golgi organisation 2
MCTLSFLPTKEGYLLAMNRDELKDRVTALPPSLYEFEDDLLLYPRERSGGTWIASNCRGDSFALMNANAPGQDALGRKRTSRGAIIPALFRGRTQAELNRNLAKIRLRYMLPFRLFAVFRESCEISQWSWDGIQLNSAQIQWTRGHWFSSSRSDKQAETERGGVCEKSWRGNTQNSLDWLRKLHSSHIPEAGAFSVCVHRPDAATVSYTEIECLACELRMSYLAGNPCEFDGTLRTINLPLTDRWSKSFQKLLSL